MISCDVEGRTLTTHTLPARLTRKVYEELRQRAKLTGKSMNAIINEALEAHFESTPVPEARLQAIVQRIVREDREILDALRDA
ncbi:ribbon-helix-helix protein, CopG family [bacterium]|nr:MAG: ribbon-helix-helix protein, CopG family [bacterium]